MYFRYNSIFSFWVRTRMDVYVQTCTRVCVCYLVILIILKSHSQQIRNETKKKYKTKQKNSSKNDDIDNNNNNRSPSISWPCSNVHCVVCILCVWWFAMNWTWYRQIPIADFTFLSHTLSLKYHIASCAYECGCCCYCCFSFLLNRLRLMKFP